MVQQVSFRVVVDLCYSPNFCLLGKQKKVLGLRISLQHEASKYKDNNIWYGRLYYGYSKNIPETSPFKMANGGPLREKGILSNQWLGFKFIPLSILYLNFFYVAQNYNYNHNF